MKISFKSALVAYNGLKLGRFMKNGKGTKEFNSFFAASHLLKHHYVEVNPEPTEKVSSFENCRFQVANIILLLLFKE